VIEAALGEDAEVFETAVVKLYFAKGERWEAAGIEGPCALVGEDQGYFFRLVDLDVRLQRGPTRPRRGRLVVAILTP